MKLLHKRILALAFILSLWLGQFWRDSGLLKRKRNSQAQGAGVRMMAFEFQVPVLHRRDRNVDVMDEDYC